MIRMFRHKGLERLYAEGDARGVRADQVRRILVILTVLDAADGPPSLPRGGFRPHFLVGQLAGFWSIRVSANWRVVFRFEDGCVVDVDLVDYH